MLFSRQLIDQIAKAITYFIIGMAIGMAIFAIVVVIILTLIGLWIASYNVPAAIVYAVLVSGFLWYSLRDRPAETTSPDEAVDSVDTTS